MKNRNILTIKTKKVCQKSLILIIYIHLNTCYSFNNYDFTSFKFSTDEEENDGQTKSTAIVETDFDFQDFVQRYYKIYIHKKTFFCLIYVNPNKLINYVLI